jgi:hypothetical protein
MKEQDGKSPFAWREKVVCVMGRLGGKQGRFKQYDKRKEG